MLAVQSSQMSGISILEKKMTDLDFFKARLTPAGKDRFTEIAGKYEIDAGMDKDAAEQKAYQDLLDEER